MSLTPRLDRLEVNKIINGNFDFWQRNNGTSTSNGYNSADRWQRQKDFAPGWEWSRSTDVPTIAESNYASTYSLQMASTSTGSPLAAEAGARAIYRMEGYDFADIHRKTVTLSFWAKSSKTGTFCVAFRNSVVDRSYVAEYTMNAINTWEKKVISLELDQAGSWNIDNTIGLEIVFTFATGTDYQTTADSWQTGDYLGTANQNNFFATTETFKLSQVKIGLGSQTSPDFNRAGKNIAEELQMCQRYCEKSYEMTINPGTATEDGTIGVRYLNVPSAGFQSRYYHSYMVEKRATPTVTFYDQAGASGRWYTGGGTSQTVGTVQNTAKSFSVEMTAPSGATTDWWFRGHFISDAEL